MSAVERWACCNPVWRVFTARAVIPWVFAGHHLVGDVLELGSGSGANAAAILDRFPDVRLTATDVDPAMLDASRRRLASFGDRVSVQPGDASALGFGDGSFDAVVSLIMLHHVGDWRTALGEAARVLRPGGRLIGYDLARTGPAAWLHRDRHPGHDLIARGELGPGLADAGFTDVRFDTALGGLVTRFAAHKPASRQGVFAGFDLSGHVSVVTGGNGGLGLGMARGLAAAGADLAIWGTNDDKTAAAVRALRELGGRVVGLHCDIRRPDQVDGATAATVEQLGRIDSFFANAGITSAAPSLMEMSFEEWRRVLEVNLDGTFLSLQAAARHMVGRGGGGSLVATSSITARFGYPAGAQYSAAKAGVGQLTQALAVELARHRIRANAIIAGTTEVDSLAEVLRSERQQRGLKRVPLRRWGQPADFAGIAVYLASPASEYHTGDSIVVDGGYLAF